MYIAQKVAGDHGFVLPLMLEKGRAKVIRPEILAGMVLEMGTGAKSAPKGGLQELIDAAEARKQRPEASGKFGEGPYKDEPWSIVALRKRVYAIRKFYEQTLVGEQATRENNPGWDDLVVNVLNSFALLLGTKPQLRSRFSLLPCPPAATLFTRAFQEKRRHAGCTQVAHAGYSTVFQGKALLREYEIGGVGDSSSPVVSTATLRSRCIPLADDWRHTVPQPPWEDDDVTRGRSEGEACALRHRRVRLAERPTRLRRCGDGRRPKRRAAVAGHKSG